MSSDLAKKNAALKAASLVSSGMTIGIGTGSTAKHFIDALAKEISAGASFKGVPTSEESDRLARAAGVEIITPDETTTIDLAVDGADEADPDRNLIKGGGGALLREKIVARAANRFIVIADGSKRVTALGAFPLPVEIEPFGWSLTVKHIRSALGQAGLNDRDLSLRGSTNGTFTTDGGNLIIDCALARIEDPRALDERLTAIPGVVETGLFCDLTQAIIYGDENGVSIDGRL